MTFNSVQSLVAATLCSYDQVGIEFHQLGEALATQAPTGATNGLTKKNGLTKLTADVRNGSAVVFRHQCNDYQVMGLSEKYQPKDGAATKFRCKMIKKTTTLRGEDEDAGGVLFCNPSENTLRSLFAVTFRKEVGREYGGLCCTFTAAFEAAKPELKKKQMNCTQSTRMGESPKKQADRKDGGTDNGGKTSRTGPALLGRPPAPGKKADEASVKKYEKINILIEKRLHSDAGLFRGTTWHGKSQFEEFCATAPNWGKWVCVRTKLWQEGRDKFNIERWRTISSQFATTGAHMYTVSIWNVQSKEWLTKARNSPTDKIANWPFTDKTPQLKAFNAELSVEEGKYTFDPVYLFLEQLVTEANMKLPVNKGTRYGIQLQNLAWSSGLNDEEKPVTWIQCREYAQYQHDFEHEKLLTNGVAKS